MSYPDDEYEIADRDRYYASLFELSGRVSDYAGFAAAQADDGRSWSEWVGCHERVADLPAPDLPEWLTGREESVAYRSDDGTTTEADRCTVPGILDWGSGLVTIVGCFAAAPVALERAQSDELRYLLSRIARCAAEVGQFTVTVPDGTDAGRTVDGRDRLANKVRETALKIGALEAAARGDVNLIAGVSGGVPVAQLAEALGDSYLADLEYEALQLLALADDLRTAAAAAETPEEAAELVAVAVAVEDLGHATLRAVARARSDYRACRVRHRPPPRHRPPRRALRGSPAAVSRCPAAPNGPPNRAPRVRHAATTAA